MSKFKRLAALGMSVIMAFSPAGCKGDNSDNDNKSKEVNGEIDDISAKYGYNVEYLPLNNSDMSKETYISHMILNGEKIYFCEEEVETEEEKVGTDNEEKEEIKGYIKGFDINSPEDIKTYAAYNWSAQNTYTYIEYIWENEDENISFIKSVYTYDYDEPEQEGTPSVGVKDIPEDAEITEEFLDRLGINLSEIDLEFSDVKGMTVKEVVELYMQLTGDDSEPVEEYDYNMQTFIVTLDENGNEISSKDISEYFTEYYSITMDNNGVLYCISPSMGMGDKEEFSTDVLIIDTKSDKIEKKKFNYYVDSVIATDDGTLVGVETNEDYESFLVTWNKDKGTFEEYKDNKINTDNITQMFSAGEKAIAYIDNETLYTFDLDTKKYTKVLKLTNWDIFGDEYPMVVFDDEEHLLIVSASYNWGNNEKDELLINRLTRVDASSVKKKKEIVFACFDSDEYVKAQAVKFNKTNSDYKIVVKEYADFDGEYNDDAYEAARLKLNQDILSGKNIDIIDIGSIDINTYAGKGLFENLYDYIEKDSEMSQKNLNKNILKMFEDEGRLMALPTRYYVSGLASDKNLLGDDLLTFDKFLQIIEENPDKEMYEYASRENVLYKLYSGSSDYFVDSKNKKCNFTDGNFENVLKIAAKFKTDEEVYENMEEMESEPKKISDGNMLFLNFQMYDPVEYQIPATLFKNGFNVTGYPSVNGESLEAEISGNLFAISSGSDYKDECWDFIKSIFEKDSTYSNDYCMGFSVDNDVLDKQIEEACRPNEYTDENGNIIQGSISSFAWEDFRLELYPLTKEQAADLKEIILSADKLCRDRYEDEIYTIIMEEADAFFNGEKSAKDVCDVIQSRADIYINENN